MPLFNIIRFRDANITVTDSSRLCVTFDLQLKAPPISSGYITLKNRLEIYQQCNSVVEFRKEISSKVFGIVMKRTE